MHNIINKIGLWINNLLAKLLFPVDLLESQAKELVSGIAKIKCDKGDRQTKYPCPAYSFFAYRHNIVRTMIWRLKYRGDRSVAKIFAKRMYDELCEELADLSEWSNFRNPLLVAIPISKNKLRLRGFNQSEAICKALATLDGNRFFSYAPNVLYKIKDTNSQARVKDKKSRLENLKDSFAVKDKIVLKNRNVILLDDVLTTGSTLSEATRMLKSANVKNIIWVVIAH
jgi:ComF family protein